MSRKKVRKSTLDRFYRAHLERDPSFEGVFIVAVRTTGIFCRPTCRARKAKRENIEFFPNAEEAAGAGYRPCKICRPTLAPVEDIPAFFKEISRRLFADPVERISDRTLKEMGYVPATVRRWFKSRYNTTFQEWQRMNRLNSAFQKLQSGQDVTSTAFDSGYESLSGFGESFKNTFGFAPSRRGPHRIIAARIVESPLGQLLACAVEEGLCYLQFTDQRALDRELRDLCRKWNARLIHGNQKHLQTLQGQLSEYFKGTRLQFDLPLAVPGTDFQNRAWRRLQEIPYGTTISYREQALGLGSPGAVRAVGSANRVNRITIVIPCHRVIGAGGDLCGYGGGLWRKKWLLAFEAKNAGRLAPVTTEQMTLPG